MKNLTDAEVEAGWDHFEKNHIIPGRMFRIATGLNDPTELEKKHLKECATCSRVFNEYQEEGVI
jgi:hypothetical protein